MKGKKYLLLDLIMIRFRTSTGLYRSCAALGSFSGTFDLIVFEAVNFGFIFAKVCFGLDRRFRQADKINGLLRLSLVWFVR